MLKVKNTEQSEKTVPYEQILSCAVGPQCVPFKTMNGDKGGNDDKGFVQNPTQRACKHGVNEPTGADKNQTGYTDGSGVISPENKGTDNKGRRKTA